MFVYGTLRSAYNNRHAQLLRRSGTLAGIARVRGQLYDMGRYPALRPARGHDEWVVGELYALRNPASLLAKLDAYEGPVYPRVRTLAVLEDGRRLPTWVYEYHRMLPEWRRMASRDYLQR